MLNVSHETGCRLHRIVAVDRTIACKVSRLYETGPRKSRVATDAATVLRLTTLPTAVSTELPRVGRTLRYAAAPSSTF